jgi:phage terminase large subunit-like protein
MRLHAQTALIENGFVHIPETAPWLTEYLHGMSGPALRDKVRRLSAGAKRIRTRGATLQNTPRFFPKGKHDDQVDSTAQFLGGGLRRSGTNSVVFRLTIGRCVGTLDSAPLSKGSLH